MTGKHTPGPWKIEHCRDCCKYDKCDYHWPGPGIFHQGTGYKLDDANLIAAAPDLLEACEEAMFLLAVWDYGKQNQQDLKRDKVEKVYNKLEQIVVKAKGG